MVKIRRVVLRVLKPEEMELVDFVRTISRSLGSAGISISILNNYSGIEDAKVRIEGRNLDFDRIKESLERIGSKIQCVEEIHCGDFL